MSDRPEIQVEVRPRFLRDLRKYKRGQEWIPERKESLHYLVELLLAGKPLPVAFDDHALRADYAGFRECHLDSDLLVIYRRRPRLVILHRIGTHRTLFKRTPPRRSR